MAEEQSHGDRSHYENRLRKPGSLQKELRGIIRSSTSPAQAAEAVKAHLDKGSIPYEPREITNLEASLKPPKGMGHGEVARRVARSFSVDFHVDPEAYVGIVTLEDARNQPLMCKKCRLFNEWYEFADRDGAEFTAKNTRQALDIKDPAMRLKELKKIQEGIHQRFVSGQRKIVDAMEKSGIDISKDPRSYGRRMRPYVHEGLPQKVDVSELTPLHGIRPEKVCAVMKNPELAILPVTIAGQYLPSGKESLEGHFVTVDGQHRAIAAELRRGRSGKAKSGLRGRVTAKPVAISTFPNIYDSTLKLAKGPKAFPPNSVSAVAKPPETTYKRLVERDLLGVMKCVNVRFKIPKVGPAKAKPKRLQARR